MCVIWCVFDVYTYIHTHTAATSRSAVSLDSTCNDVTDATDAQILVVACKGCGAEVDSMWDECPSCLRAGPGMHVCMYVCVCIHACVWRAGLRGGGGVGSMRCSCQILRALLQRHLIFWRACWLSHLGTSLLVTVLNPCVWGRSYGRGTQPKIHPIETQVDNGICRPRCMCVIVCEYSSHVLLLNHQFSPVFLAFSKCGPAATAQDSALTALGHLDITVVVFCATFYIHIYICIYIYIYIHIYIYI